MKAVNSTLCASAAAATALLPSRPISARSTVIMAICPSWVSASGPASLTVPISSSRQTRAGAEVSMPPDMLFPLGRDKKFAVAVAPGNR